MRLILADDSILLREGLIRLLVEEGHEVLAAVGDALGERDHDRAIGDLDEAIRLSPKIALYYSERGFAFSEKGDHDRAIKDLDEAIKWASEIPSVGRGSVEVRPIADFDMG